MLIWGLTALIVFPVTVIYSELAAMFPNKSGGVAIYAKGGLKVLAWGDDGKVTVRNTRIGPAPRLSAAR